MYLAITILEKECIYHVCDENFRQVQFFIAEGRVFGIRDRPVTEDPVLIDI